MRNQCLLRSCVLFFGLILFSPLRAEAVAVTAVWSANPEPDIWYYLLSYGTSQGGPYSTVDLDVGGGTSFGPIDLAAGQRYYFVLKAVNTSTLVSVASAEAFIDVGTPFFDSPPVVTVTPVKAIHTTDLRDRINGVRLARSLSAFSWVEAVTPLATTVTAQHVTEMRAALDAAYVAAGLTPPVYTALSAGTLIQAVHYNELRAAVIAIETAP